MGHVQTGNSHRMQVATHETARTWLQPGHVDCTDLKTVVFLNTECTTHPTAFVNDSFHLPKFLELFFATTASIP